MTQPLTAREEILSRIRTALPGSPTSIEASYRSIPRTYERHGKLDREACLRLFVDRLLDYDAEVVELGSEAELPEAIDRILQKAGEEQLLVPPGFPETWLPHHVTHTIDHNLSTQNVDQMQAILTTCEAAVASTGTIFIVHHGTQGRRIDTLLPDHHLCLVHRDQVHELLPETLDLLDRDGPPITSISGPSATSDIEMTRIRGVHGPRRLTVILYG